MNKDWFKAAMRRANKTTADLAATIGRDRAVVSRILNGHQPITFDQVTKFATELDVPVDVVMQQSGLSDAATAKAMVSGFSDGDAAPFAPEAKLKSHIATMREALGGTRPGIDVWQAKSNSMHLAGILANDFMLVDTHAADRAKDGDVVVAQIYDNSSGGATTVLRRYRPPVLVGASADPKDQTVNIVDNVNCVIRGRVVASWRENA